MIQNLITSITLPTFLSLLLEKQVKNKLERKVKIYDEREEKKMKTKICKVEKKESNKKEKKWR